MTSRVVCKFALILWLLTAALLGWLLIRGWTTQGTDGRLEIVVAPSERDLVLTQMRQFLQAIRAVLIDVGSADPNEGFKGAETAARKVGMGMDKDVPPILMVKLPKSFKEMGMAVHQDFDQLADGIGRGETTTQIIKRLSSVTSRCTTCHELYRLSPRQ